MSDSDKEPHPEKLPDVVPFEEKRFIFSTTAGKEAITDIDKELSQLEDRISRLARRKELNINGIPILQHLVGLTQDRDELRVLGKALIRVADLMPRLQQLQKQKSVIEMANENPRWLMATFADFSDDVDALVGEDDDIEA